jgi:RNA recognition motif-containing protein
MEAMTTRLFIGNLSFAVSEQELLAAFAPYQATSAEIPTRWSRSQQKADRPKGFGYVDVPAAQSQAAIKGMQGQLIDGRAIDICAARPRPSLNPPSGGRYSRRG